MDLSNSCFLYDTTFSLYRVSPLYTGNSAPLDNRQLSFHARQFQEILEGEVLRGVQVRTATEKDLIFLNGPLKSVDWSVFHEEYIFFQDNQHATTEGDNRVMMLTVSFDKVVYRAIFLQHIDRNGVGAGKSQAGFHHFPLLLLKMPTSIRKIFMEYVATEFDARLSSLVLSQKCLTNAFERYIAKLYNYDSDDASKDLGIGSNLSNIIKDTFVRIGFDLPNGSTSLRTIDVKIPREDVAQLINSSNNTVKLPFFEAIGAYLNTHLALDLWNPKVKIVRITCAALILDIEGKLRHTFPLSIDADNLQILAARKLTETLIEAAIGSALNY